MTISISPWDPVLVLVVTAMGTLLAYVPDPRWKAFLLGLPFPFTIANLSLGQSIGPGHVLGVAVLLLFVNLVRVLHHRLRLAIIPSIAVSACAYLALAVVLNRIVPKGAVSFWGSLLLVMSLGILLVALVEPRRESAHRSPLPLGLKVAAIAAVVIGIVMLKQVLGGFMTMFPMVSTIAAYESRHSLWTLSRQVPFFILEVTPMLAVMWLAQHLFKTGIPLSLAAGWVAFLAVMVPVTITQMRRRPDVSPVAIT